MQRDMLCKVITANSSTNSHYVNQDVAKISSSLFLTIILIKNIHLSVAGQTIEVVESNTAALIGSVCVDVKGEISHATLNMMIKIKRLQLSHIVCINMILQNKVQRSVANNSSIGEGPRISITITVQGKVHSNSLSLIHIWRCRRRLRCRSRWSPDH